MIARTQRQGDSPEWETVPDPCVSLFDHTTSSEDYSKGRAWLGQRQRRSDIFAATRALLTDHDFDGVHIQTIAQSCNLSPQTIYNLVGAKAQVMEQASAEWVEGIRIAAQRRAVRADVSAAFVMIEMFWDSALSHGAFVRSTARLSSRPTDPLNPIFFKVSTAAIAAEIRKLNADGALRDGTDAASLARQLTLLTHATINTWCVRPSTLEEYRRDLENGPGAMLRGAMRGPDLHKLERYIEVRAPH